MADTAGKSADELKQLGNEAFSAKNYEEAIRFYTSAIRADGTNHVFYSNRSACYASQTKWQLAANDAKECIKIDPTFIKGYYRLATAQTELNHLDAATATIKQGLNIDNTNPQLMKQLQTVKQAQKRKKAAAMRTTNAATSNATAVAAADGSGGISKELQDLHQAYVQSIREAKTVEANIAMAQREYKAQQLTKTELEQLPVPQEPQQDDGTSNSNSDTTSASTNMYRSIGKMFLRASRSDIMDHIEKTMEAEQTKETDFIKKQQYLEKRIQSQQQNIQELLPASARRKQ